MSIEISGTINGVSYMSSQTAALSTDGKVVAIGSKNQSTVRVHTWNETDWSTERTLPQRPSENLVTSSSDNFGCSVALSANGDILVVGALGRTDPIHYFTQGSAPDEGG